MKSQNRRSSQATAQRARSTRAKAISAARLARDLSGETGVGRTRTPDFELKLQRAGSLKVEIVSVVKSGEAFELEEQLRRLAADMPRLTPLVSPRDALPSLGICREIEPALLVRRAIELVWAKVAGQARAVRLTCSTSPV